MNVQRSGSSRVRLHPQEDDRLDSLASYGVLDTPSSSGYDAVTALAARLCGTPFAAVTLVDASRQWFKSAHGLALRETPREFSFCSDVVADGAVMTVPDAAVTLRHRSNPLVVGAPHLRGYLGVPLMGRDGLPLGALCVIDRRPRDFTARHIHELEKLAAQVVALLEQDRRDRGDGLLEAWVVDEARDARRLRSALDNGEFIAFYQPVVDIHTGLPQQLEALLRWQHPVHGTLPPLSFLPAVEASALVVPIGRAVLDAALAQLATLAEDDVHLPGGVAVNVASGQLARPGLARDVLAALERHHLDGQQLTLEITEATDLPDLDIARRELCVLREIGVHVAVDDFGVGWSNLTRIMQLPVDALKIDRALAGAVLSDPMAAAMVASTIALADTLGLQVTAEGIETPEVRAHLAALGCHRGQGWLYSAAVDAKSISSVLRDLETLHTVATGRHEPTRAASPWTGSTSALARRGADAQPPRYTVPVVTPSTRHPASGVLDQAVQDSALKAVLHATRALLSIETSTDVAAVVLDLVHALGGEVVGAREAGGDALPIDVSFGEGEPMLPVAPPASGSRLMLECYLPGLVRDAHRALELAERSSRLAEDAAIDPLTGLSNRRMLGRALGRLHTDDTVIVIDLDHFKTVNDNLGHAEGDRVLRCLGKTLRACVRATDMVGRYGGEEFVVILGTPEADAFLDRLRTTWTEARPHPITFSAGVAPAAPDPHQALKAADRAMYRAKQGGRDQWQWAAPDDYL